MPTVRTITGALALSTLCFIALALSGCGRTPTAPAAAAAATTERADATPSQDAAAAAPEGPILSAHTICRHLQQNPCIARAITGPAPGQITVVLKAGTEIDGVFDTQQRMERYLSASASDPKLQSVVLRRSVLDTKIITAAAQTPRVRDAGSVVTEWIRKPGATWTQTSTEPDQSS